MKINCMTNHGKRTRPQPTANSSNKKKTTKRNIVKNKRERESFSEEAV